MTLVELLHKLHQKAWQRIINALRKKELDVYVYQSYWHQKLFGRSNRKVTGQKNFFTAIPNPRAGIGHQMANWIAGFWFARNFQLNFAHTPFSTNKWDQFLGFGENEENVTDLLNKGYKKVRLPYFHENRHQQVELTKRIIDSYENRKVVFIAELDQFYQDQFGPMEDLKKKFHEASSRKSDCLQYSKAYCNIAIHVRRGDILKGKETGNPNHLMRIQNNAYFKEILTSVVKNLQTEKPIKIYFFSQGDLEDFPEFNEFENIVYCLAMGAMESFLHMVYADILITSKSSFSYKPALLNKGIKICPRNFWHGYPDGKEWILAEEDGYFNPNLLIQ